MTKKNVARSWGGGSRFTDPTFIAYFVVFRGEIFYTVLDEEQETFFFFSSLSMTRAISVGILF